MRLGMSRGKVLPELRSHPLPPAIAEEPLEEFITRRLPLLDKHPHPVPNVVLVLRLLEQPVARDEQTLDTSPRYHGPIVHVFANAKDRTAAKGGYVQEAVLVLDGSEVLEPFQFSYREAVCGS